MSIKSWPLQERPREKLLQLGAKNLSDAELIAILLRTGIKGKNAVELARDLLAHFSGIRGLLNASQKELAQIKGCGISKHVQLQAAREIHSRYLLESLKFGTALKNTHITEAYLCSQLRDRRQEIFAVLFLNSQYQVLAFEELFFGTIDGSTVHPREVVIRVLHYNAAAVILAHNHPSGLTNPSGDDIHLTKVLQQALALIDVKVLDHFIIGEGGVTSMAKKGLL